MTTTTNNNTNTTTIPETRRSFPSLFGSALTATLALAIGALAYGVLTNDGGSTETQPVPAQSATESSSGSVIDNSWLSNQPYTATGTASAGSVIDNSWLSNQRHTATGTASAGSVIDNSWLSNQRRT